MASSSRRLFVLGLAIFVVGLGAGYGARRSGEKSARSELSRIRGRFAALSESDLAEYNRLKALAGSGNERARCAKADEVLGKIMLALIADFGLKTGAKALPVPTVGEPLGPEPFPSASPSPSPSLAPSPSPVPSGRPNVPDEEGDEESEHVLHSFS